MYNLHLFILPFIFLCLLLGGFGYKTAQKNGQIPPKLVPFLNLGIGSLLVLFLYIAISKAMEIDSFRRLKPDDVISVQFYHEALAPQECQFDSAQLAPACLEQTISDKKMLKKLVDTFRFSRGYSPNHEGVRSPYLAVVNVKQSENIWLLLGNGVRNNSQTTWLEIQLSPNSHSQSNVYHNPELYQVLKKELRLKAWR
jgi:hypothetical protein